MTKSCKAFIKYSFIGVHLAKVGIGISTNNIKSVAIPEHLGFTLEGILETTR
ncbi:RimJ/RimL family protein N-acetyltransferase [Paenibacillus amylolyticus]|uniref:RimJ/RimL family protein N-acetyltransferase n=2 Tax=Paenibacillus amylolyticus TaxID=1451 RepID=A0AAP5H5E3_PAEAM|nr:RimJ/RimL family protein N-acetyltransferase [Paenibacillus amylolyticus]